MIHSEFSSFMCFLLVEDKSLSDRERISLLKVCFPSPTPSLNLKYNVTFRFPTYGLLSFYVLLLHPLPWKCLKVMGRGHTCNKKTRNQQFITWDFKYNAEERKPEKGFRVSFNIINL